MANYEITLTVEAARKESVEKKLRETFGVDIPVHSTEKVKTAESRADRLGEAESNVEDAKSIVEELKDELQEWCDGLPENLQGSDKASQLDAAISALDDLSSSLENCDFGSVDFPGMY